METISGAALAQDCRAGELRAFEELVQRHERAVPRVIRGYVRDPQEAQDIARETYLRVYQALDCLGESQWFGAWLGPAAQRGSLSGMRARRRAGALHAALGDGTNLASRVVARLLEGGRQGRLKMRCFGEPCRRGWGREVPVRRMEGGCLCLAGWFGPESA